MLAATIGIDRAIKRDVGTVIARDDRPCGFVSNFSFKDVEAAEAVPTVVKRLPALNLETPRMIGARSAAASLLRCDWCIISDARCSI